ncbi:MAG: 16S rRNA (adenine(1518)-N(6)/adenine(1519)-N(6))-dimethyltransferase RsmA [Euryarchaeota archaeon]
MRSAEYLAYLRRRYGLRPNRRLGQHFMVDDRLLRFMVEAAEVGPDDTVLEIGPGPGLLTRYLVERAGRVVAVELDERMVEVLERELGDAGNLEIVRADFLEYGVPEEANKVVANLPYQISSEATFKILRSDVERAVLTYQREFAERMTAEPGTRGYGRLTVMVNLLARVEVLRAVPRRAFVPPPRVSSAIVRLDPLPESERPDVDPETLEAVCRGLFQHRRKTVRNALRLSAHEWGGDEEVVEEILERLPEKLLGKRPLHLTPEEVVRVARCVERVRGSS